MGELPLLRFCWLERHDLGDLFWRIVYSGCIWFGISLYAVFIALVILQLVLGGVMKREVAYLQKDAKKVDLTPWAPAPYVGVGLVTTVVVLYAMLAIL